MRDVSVPCVTTPVAGDVIKPQRSSGKEGGVTTWGKRGCVGEWGVTGIMEEGFIFFPFFLPLE